MNPYLIIAALVALAAAGAGGFYEGRVTGINSQKVADQGQFDATNAALTKQKADAAVILAQANADNLALMQARDTLKTNLEKAHAAAQIATDAVRTQLAGSSLRFAVPSAGRGEGGAGAQSPGSDPAGNASPAYCVVSAETDAALKAIAYDADTLRDDYTLLYNWAHSLK